MKTNIYVKENTDENIETIHVGDPVDLNELSIKTALDIHDKMLEQKARILQQRAEFLQERAEMYRGSKSNDK